MWKSRADRRVRHAHGRPATRNAQETQIRNNLGGSRLRERATRLAVEARREPATRVGVYKRIGDQLGVHPEALRTWVKQAEVDDGLAPGTSTADAVRIAELEREVRELRRANSILKSAASFFAAELDRPIR